MGFEGLRGHLESFKDQSGALEALEKPKSNNFEDVSGHLLDSGGSEAESSRLSSNLRGGAEAQELREQVAAGGFVVRLGP